MRHRRDEVRPVRLHGSGEGHKSGREEGRRISILLQQDLECHEVLAQRSRGGIQTSSRGGGTCMWMMSIFILCQRMVDAIDREIFAGKIFRL